MAKFWEIKKMDHFSAANKLRKLFPELRNVSNIDDTLRLGQIFVLKQKQATSHKWIRLTLPFAFIFCILLFLFLPFRYMVTGSWDYNSQWVYNWFKSLGW